MALFQQFGATRKDAEQSGFFRWFMLDPASAEPPLFDPRSAHYRPNGPAFHELTEVVLLLEADDRIRGLELHLARSFIDHSHNGHFARDIAKSFLRGAVSDAAGRGVQELADEIEFSRNGMAPVLSARQVHVDLPNPPTPGYQVFLGQHERFGQVVEGMDLVVENYRRDGVPWLRMTLTSR